VEEGTLPFGFAAEVGCSLLERGALANRVFSRVGALEKTIAASKELEKFILPQAEDVRRAVLAAIGGEFRD
jgi:hypothetical protein